MTITKTLGTSGADFTSINAWVSWVQANAVSAGNLTDNVTLNTLSVGVSPGSGDTISGWAPGGSNFQTALSADSSNNANQNASVQTRAFFYNAGNGAFWDYSALSASSVGVDVQVDKCTISNMQMKMAVQYAIMINGQHKDLTISHCILGGANKNVAGIVFSGTSTMVVQSTLIYALYSTGLIACTGLSGLCTSYDNTLVVTGSPYSTIGIKPDNYQTWRITNTAFIGAHTEVKAGGTQLGSNNGTTNASFTGPSTAAQTSVALTDFVGGASLNDFRLSPTAAKLKSNGTSSAFDPSSDWAYTTIPQGTEYDIGAWALKNVNVAPFVVNWA
jgi:hypothetical protein